MLGIEMDLWPIVVGWTARSLYNHDRILVGVAVDGVVNPEHRRSE